jgi:hypothetical protein
LKNNRFEVSLSTMEPIMSFEPVYMSDPDFDMVVDLTRKTFPTACILTIDRVHNSMLKERFDNHVAHVARAPTVQRLYHGTREEYVVPICTTGFNSKLNKRTLFGRGNYFSTSFGYSKVFSSSNQHYESLLLICQVCVGQSCLGKSGMTIRTDTYDSAVNDLAKPSIYVVPRDEAILPEFVVRFSTWSETTA